MIRIKKGLQRCTLLLLVSSVCCAEFRENFDKKEFKGWQFFTVAGFVTMKVTQRNGYAAANVDAIKDPCNVWYAMFKRSIPPFELQAKLSGTTLIGYENAFHS